MNPPFYQVKVKKNQSVNLYTKCADPSLNGLTAKYIFVWSYIGQLYRNNILGKHKKKKKNDF